MCQAHPHHMYIKFNFKGCIPSPYLTLLCTVRMTTDKPRTVERDQFSFASTSHFLDRGYTLTHTYTHILE